MTFTVTRLTPAVVALLVANASPSLGQDRLPPHWEESGLASWYGPGFEGRTTSNGDRFEANALTAAHDTLPLGTRIRVTTQETGRSIVVVVTDRMPPKHARIIDLSRAAAKQLGLLYAGTGMVTLSEAHASDPEEEPIEVAETPDDDPGLNPLPHGRRHTRLAAQAASAHHPCCHATSAALAQR